MSSFKYTKHPLALKDQPETLTIKFAGKKYSFHFYINSYGRYVALCNTMGCEKHHGEGANWWDAAALCMTRILND